MRLACHFIVLGLVAAMLYFCTVPYVQVAQPDPAPALVPPHVQPPPGVWENPVTRVWELIPPVRADPAVAPPLRLGSRGQVLRI